MKRLAAAAAAAVLTAACAGGVRRAPARAVVVEGWAPLGASPRAEVRRRALADAARRAVEQAGGVEVAALSTVDDAERVRERVSSAAVGTVRELKVLGEGEADGGLRVRVRAVVAERVDGAPRDGWIAGIGPSARVAALDEDLRGPFAAAWSSCGGSLADEGEEPELSFRLTASARRFEEPRVRPFVSVRVRVRASARGAGGEAWSGSRESAALGADESQARSLAMREAGEALARDAARALSGRLWPASGRSGR